MIPNLVPPCSGMLVLVFARNNLRSSIGEVTTSSVACGVLGVGGNKGAVAVEFSVHRRRVAVVCSHFAAHQVRPVLCVLRGVGGEAGTSAMAGPAAMQGCVCAMRLENFNVMVVA